MKKVKISLDDILVVLEAMRDNGTSEIIFFDREGIPALCDADEPDNIIMFQTFDTQEKLFH